MGPTATIAQAADKLIAVLQLGSRGPVILVGELYCSFDVARVLAEEVQHAGLRFLAVLATPTRHEAWSPISAPDQVVFLHGLEFLDKESVVAHWKTLNRRRDEFRQQAGLTVLWLPETEVAGFTRHCPDLFAWRSFLERVRTTTPEDERARLQLASCITRSETVGAPSVQQVRPSFAPVVDGRPGPPKELAWILSTTDAPWLVASDLPAAVAAVWSLAREKAWQWLARIEEPRSLTVPVHVSTRTPDTEIALAASCLGPHLSLIDHWAREDWVSAVLVLDSGLSHAVQLTVVGERAPGLRLAVLSQSPPERLPDGFRRFDAVPDYVAANRRRLLQAGLPEWEVARVESLGLLELPSENALRLVADRARRGGLPEDNLGVFEGVFDEPRDRASERQALEELSGLPELDADAEPAAAARRLMLAARALLGSNWVDVLLEFGLLAAPQATDSITMALGRRLRTYGPEAWLREVESLVEGLDDPLERSILLTAAVTASSAHGKQAPDKLSRRARTHLNEHERSLEADAPTDDDGVLRASLLALRAVVDLASTKRGERSWSDRHEPAKSKEHRMDSSARKFLSSTIRSLRARLLDDLHAATETAYRLSVRTRDAGLDEASRVRRGRLEAWVAEQLRAQGATKAKGIRSAEEFRREAEKQAAYTLLNRLVLLRLMETPGPSGEPLRAPAVVTGGWESRAYKDMRQLAPGLVRGDETEGYAFLLQLIFEELATELPGLYGPVGIADLVPVPASTLRHVIDALNAPELDSCWTDDMTLGWVYQYWNDPEREASTPSSTRAARSSPTRSPARPRCSPSATWWTGCCRTAWARCGWRCAKKRGWTPEVEGDGTLAALEARRVEWRAKREANEVELTALMPLRTDAERRWAYYLPQPVPDDAVEKAPDSVRDLKLLDPAVGSGHFLVVAFDLLLALYREEARHRGEAGTEPWTDRAIIERILSHNLHGIDLDPRAVQIAAAALWLKAQQLAPGARPERLNLVASNLRLASLPEDDPALVELRREVERETGIPGALTDTLIHALRGADHLGSLLKVDKAVDEALGRHETTLGRVKPDQGDIFTGFATKRERKAIGRDEAKATLLDRLEVFLARHTSGDDLGLRLRGEQFAAGVRFVRMVREGAYDLVVANPPYQGTSRLAESNYIEKTYPLGKADLYAAFLLRGLELVREGGVSAMLTMRNWMFIKQYAGLRGHLLATHGLRALHDLSSGAFEEISAAQVVVSVVSSIFSRELQTREALGLKVFDDQTVTTVGETLRKRATTLCHEGCHTFDPAALKVVPKWPLVYWWDAAMLRLYQSAPLIGDVAPAKMGANVGDNLRFHRRVHEVHSRAVTSTGESSWAYLVKGAEGKSWFEPAEMTVNWRWQGIEIKWRQIAKFGDAGLNWKIANSHFYFRRGIAFSMIGANFSARVHRYPSIFGDKGSSIFPKDVAGSVCAMNSSRARAILASLNPSISFQVGDVNRLPLFPITNADAIFAKVGAAFTLHESHREPSVEFRRPGPSPWRHAQEWAQQAVDRPDGAPLPEYVEVLDPEPPTDPLSFALGVALGRFGPAGSAQEGILDPATADLALALPHGILFLDTTLDDADHRDGLGHAAAAPLHAAWAAHGQAIGTKRTLREWLALDFFKDVHRQMYENRPIHWPLSSSGKTFVVWVNIHRFTEQTLRVILADHLMPTLARLEGELTDLRAARDSADRKAARAAERQLDRVMKAKDELAAFIAAVEQGSDRGAPPTDNKCPPRERDARYAPNLDDGVMINSAALWPLLDPQWKEPKRWWKELATSIGKKDYDWSHLAMRYWPTRIDKKCQRDPSLGVAHGCFWRYHPARAWAWELRLQDEIGADFRIEEPPYRPGGRDLGDGGDRPHRDAWLADHPAEALEAIETEAIRRMGRGKHKKLVSELSILETGLWSGHAELLWGMELRLAKRQGVELRILAPDEPEARANFEAKHPDKVLDRESFLASLVPSPELFDDDEADTDGDDDALDDDEDGEEDDDA
jgi:hypothetical protein